VIALLVALAPGLRLRMISSRDVTQVRDYWLLGVLACGIVAIAPAAPWLALMGVWFLIHWRSVDYLPSVVTWGAIGATWFMLRGLPDWVWSYLPWVWLAWAGYQVTEMVTHVYRHGMHRAKGTLGSPAATALYLALVAPFCPWWGWPVLAVGLWLSWSWLALLAVGAGVGYLYPVFVPLGAILALTGGVLWGLGIRHKATGERWLSIKGRAPMDWTPRGQSLAPVEGRLAVWKHALVRLTWLGHGPGSCERDIKRWASSHRLRGAPDSELHHEILQQVYEYGLIGAMAAAAFAWQVGGHLKAGDPWSAAFIVGLVLSIGHWPMRLVPVGVVWLAVAAGVMR
jgi:hypothetical protein